MIQDIAGNTKGRGCRMTAEAQEVIELRPETLIIGLTGSLGSGCTFVAKGLRDELTPHAHYYRVSDVLRDLAKQRDLAPDNTPVLQDLGNRLRESDGMSVLAQRSLDRINEDIRERKFEQSEDTVVLLDGIRNDGEVRYLQQFPNFYLLSVHADKDVRASRTVGSGAPDRRFDTFVDFDKADARDQHEDMEYGQQVKRCNYLADVIIENNDAFVSASERQKRDFFNRLAEQYVVPMKKAARGEPTHERPPSIDETLMTMAYCASKRSSCAKRKVGAVIAWVGEIPGHEDDADLRTDQNRWFQVLSSGYNEVPLGETPCVFTKVGRCYRDHLKEESAKRFKHCPNCGEEIPAQIECPHCQVKTERGVLSCPSCQNDLETSYECPKCKRNVISEFVVGAGGASGKLLDMCRALHAEENAILRLTNVPARGDGCLVLYTTTFPCNLCANKIVAAGIRRIVFAEPYTMKESKAVLDRANIPQEKFQGVKSRAYFRLYR